ncbi:MAG: deoxyribose-phosphate aldolase [Clostridia bacterium]|nr:deoxyribose-phosphate aldolase [Clostridia bacterium]
MDVCEIMKFVDHTLLSQAATWEEIRVVCDDARRYGTASVCIPPSFVKQAAEYLEGSLPVCTVIGFPNGYQTTEVKGFETMDALQNGAAEIDMVIHVGALRAGQYDKVLEEIRTIKRICGSHILKVIIETCLLNESEKMEMCRIVAEAGADFIKTSTGFSTGGATSEDIQLFAEQTKGTIGIKAAGGIRSFEDAEKFLSLGATRLGTSRLVAILKKDPFTKNY